MLPFWELHQFKENGGSVCRFNVSNDCLKVIFSWTRLVFVMQRFWSSYTHLKAGHESFYFGNCRTILLVKGRRPRKPPDKVLNFLLNYREDEEWMVHFCVDEMFQYCPTHQSQRVRSRLTTLAAWPHSIPPSKNRVSSRQYFVLFHAAQHKSTAHHETKHVQNPRPTRYVGKPTGDNHPAAQTTAIYGGSISNLNRGENRYDKNLPQSQQQTKSRKQRLWWIFMGSDDLVGSMRQWSTG